MHTLIVEDDELTSMLFVSFLTGYGKCDVAADGKAGLDRFTAAHESSARYDLICLDLMMPEINGIELLKMIREWEASKGVGEEERVRVVMTTAVGENKVIQEAYDAKCDAYLIKPIIRSQLLDTVAELGLIEQRAKNS